HFLSNPRWRIALRQGRCSRSGLDLFAVGLEEPHLGAVLERADADTVALAGGRVEEHDVRLVDRHRLVDHTAGFALHGVRPLVLLDEIDAFDEQMLGPDPVQDGAALALVATCDDDDLVALADFLHRDYLRGPRAPATRSS